MSVAEKIKYDRILCLSIGIIIGIIGSYATSYLVVLKQGFDEASMVPKEYIVGKLFGKNIIHAGIDEGYDQPINFIQSFFNYMGVDSLYKDSVDQQIIGFDYTMSSDFGVAQIFYNADEIIACAFYNQIDTRINKCFRPTHILRIFNTDSLTYAYDHYNDTLIIHTVPD